jgi:hypothetical protein
MPLFLEGLFIWDFGFKIAVFRTDGGFSVQVSGFRFQFVFFLYPDT